MQRSNRTNRVRVTASAASAAAALCLLQLGTASAATHTWTGATDANWNTAGNWSTNAVPNVNTEDVVFNAPGAANLGVNANTGTFTIRSLTFSADATSPVTINVAQTNKFTIAGQTGDDVVVSAGSHLIKGGTGPTNPEIQLTSTDFNIASGTSLEINARISAGASGNSYSKSGAGTLIFSAQNGSTGGWNFTGGTFSINGGALVLRSSQAIGNSGNRVTVNNGGVLQLENNSYVATNGVVTLNNGGTLRAVGATSNRAIGAGSSFIALNGTSNLEASDGTMTLTHALTGSGSIVKTGAGTVVFNDFGSSTYTGQTAVNTGTLALTANGTLGQSPVIDVRSGAALNVTANPAYSVSANQSLGGNGTVYGNVNLAGTNSAIAPGSSPGTLTFANDLTLTAGQLSLDLANVTTTGSGVNDLIVVNGALNLAGSTNLNINRLNGTLAAGGTYVLAQAAGGISGAGTLTVPVVRQGLTLAVVGNDLQLTAGTGAAASLQWKGDGSSSTWQTNGANVWLVGASPDKYYDWDDVTFNDDLGSNSSNLTVSGIVVPNTVSISNSAVDYTFGGSGAVTGVNTLTKAGSRTATFSNAGGLSVTALNANDGTLILNTPTSATTATVGGGALQLTAAANFGTTNVNSGTLEIGNGATAGSVTGSVTNNGWVALNNPGDNNYSTTFSGSGTVEKKGGGVGTISANNSGLTGTFRVSGGTVKPTNSNALGATAGDNVIVANGAALDLASGAAQDALNFGSRNFHIQGTGVGGTGAIVNSGTTRQFNAFNFITLDNDATIAGFRMDIGRVVPNGVLDLNGRRLTLNMTGAQALFGLLNTVSATAGTIEVVGGTFDIERAASVLADGSGSNIIFQPNTNFQAFESAANSITRPMTFKGGNMIGGGNNNASIVDAPMHLEGDVTVQQMASGVGSLTGAGILTLNGVISDDGGTRSITKLGASTAILGGANTYGGNTNVNGGTLRLATTGKPGTGALNVADGAFVDVVAGRTDAVKVGALSIGNNGTLDLQDNDMIIASATAMSTVESYISTARNGGSWDKPGITSSVANALGPTGITSLGAISGADYATFGHGDHLFDGVAFVDSDTLVKYTYNGDANLSGGVDFDDYVRIDVGFNTNLTGWSNGDFNYSGQVNFDDYVMIDVAFNTQGGTLGRAVRYLTGEDRGGTGLDSPGMLEVVEHFGEFGPTYAAAFLAAVPEPSSLLLASAGVVASATMRRRRSRA